MHIVVAGKQVETGDALKVHVSDGLKGITRKYFDHALEAQVTFRKDAKGKQGAFFACDINLHAGRGLSVRGEGHGTDAHRAFDEAAEHVAKRLRRYRRRVNEHARSFAEERMPAEQARQFILRDEPDDLDEGETPASEQLNGVSHTDGLGDGAADGAAHADGADGHAPSTVVAETHTEIARLTVREAVMRMDLAHTPVLMFRNRAHGQLNVVYRRPDGHVGWIDPGD
ncbi:ribosome-associated translation inhibitor RaiA [Acetobacteraceae bacterium H6797]|nr:ribosome-associated translation inhibitor RaiA [Acetobacteraceae bacterium H6797]